MGMWALFWDRLEKMSSFKGDKSRMTWINKWCVKLSLWLFHHSILLNFLALWDQIQASEAANSRLWSHHAPLLCSTKRHQHLLNVCPWLGFVDQRKQHHVPWPKLTQQPHDHKEHNFSVRGRERKLWVFLWSNTETLWQKTGVLTDTRMNKTKDKRAVITTIEFIAWKQIKSNETTAY